MAKDHFIPAGLLARFTDDPKDSSRLSKVCSLRSNGARALVRAESIGYSRNLYDVDGEMFPTRGTRAVDSVWDSYEPDLSRALDKLIGGSVTASEWINILVPFVAASFGRDRGYKARVVGRFAREIDVDRREFGELVLNDTNIAINRILEMERFASRALACEWTVCEVRDDLVIPDIGYCLELVHQYPDIISMQFPIGRRHLLILTPRPSGLILKKSNGGWGPTISYARLEVPSELLNRALATTAQDFVVGTRTSIDQVKADDLSQYTWETIDQILEQWPFRVDTRNLSGLRRAVQEIVDGNLDSLDHVYLDPLLAISELEPQAELVSATGRRVPADAFLTLHRNGLDLSVD